MAEKSPRPEEEEEDGDEEGEEAAEAPARPVRVVTVKAEEPREEATAPDSPPPPPPGEAEEAPLLASPPSSPNPTPQPAVPDPAADHPSVSGVNLFANDGSFLELFKKKMEAGNKEESKEPDTRKPVILVGKRRGGAKLALKTGIVAKKPKTEDEEILTHKGGAWAQYMAEVKKYKAHQCSDDDKTRPLVK
ncbi:telomerase RNA component interacting RNase [Bufo gargarizans]|uniref:telomerase RNA component interacting RNase n=1 Tax=Bufo gargarizans TaxID=30331 RepID=UPI001CF37FE0|nr:telomerase RNA component interacting RNase [Bufo gargarizans]